MSQDHAIEDEVTPPPPTGAVARLGEEALTFVQTGRELYGIFIRTLYFCVRGRREPGSIAFYMHEVGNKSVFFLSVVMGLRSK